MDQAGRRVRRGEHDVAGPWEVAVEQVEQDLFVDRVAALDIGKAELVCCVRLPGRPGRRRQWCARARR